MAFVEET